jgi:hypothetical protein
MSLAKKLLIAFGLMAWLAASSLGQEPARQTPPATAPAPAPAARPPAADANKTPPAADAPEDASKASNEEFIPTEELAPDAAITFPVDI